MHLLTPKRTLLRTMVAGVVVLAGALACSRSDRADAERDGSQTSAVTPADTQSARATQPPIADTATSVRDTSTSRAASKSSGPTQPTPAVATGDTSAELRDQAVSGYQAMGQDTTSDTASVAVGQPTGDTSRAQTDTVVVGDSAQIGKTGERLEGNQSSEQANADSLANQPESDRVRPPEDSSEMVGAGTIDTVGTTAIDSDSAVAGATEMARDTSAAVDTAIQVSADTAVQAPADTATLQARVDTTAAEQQAEVAVETRTDTVAVVGDSAEVGKAGERLEANEATPEANADTLATETERVRPPEDSTETLGNVNAEAVGDADAVPVGAAQVQPTGQTVTGAAAVALMSREGRRCAVLDAEEARDAQWDLASSPATMNPCGTGTMTLPRVQTAE
jgi:hypothetical protein